MIDVYKRQMLHSPKRIIVCEKDASRLQFIRRHYPQVLTVQPEDCAAFVRAYSDHDGADVVLEVAGADSTFRLAWECACLLYTSRKRCRETKMAPEGLLQLSGATLCALCLGAHDRRFTRSRSGSGSQAKPSSAEEQAAR